MTYAELEKVIYQTSPSDLSDIHAVLEDELAELDSELRKAIFCLALMNTMKHRSGY